jgi:hypothetical protein
VSVSWRCERSGRKTDIFIRRIGSVKHQVNIMVLVKPATVVRWHRQGFQPYWRWRSRPGRPSVDREVRDLIRQMNSANPLWGAPRIHGQTARVAQ